MDRTLRRNSPSAADRTVVEALVSIYTLQSHTLQSHAASAARRAPALRHACMDTCGVLRLLQQAEERRAKVTQPGRVPSLIVMRRRTVPTQVCAQSSRELYNQFTPIVMYALP